MDNTILSNFNHIQMRTNNSIMKIQINRPDLDNKINKNTLQEIQKCLLMAEEQNEIRVIVLYGTKEYFCTGSEIDGFPKGSDKERKSFADYFIQYHQSVKNLTKPLIGVVEGKAFAGGLSLLSACDLVYASSDSEFGLPELEYGLSPLLAMATTIERIPKIKMFELFYQADTISSQEAKKMYLINEYFPQVELWDKVDEICYRISEKSPTGISHGRQAYYQMEMLNEFQSLEASKNILLNLLNTEDALEAHYAIRENRTPVWKGK